MAEIILAPTAQSKVIPLSLRLNDTDASLVSQLVTNRQFSTADTDAWFSFTLGCLASTTGTFDLTLINLHDKSVFNHTDKVFNTNPFYYKLDSGTDELTNEIRHAGKWVGQLVVTLANGDSATRKFIFGIEGHILDGTVVQTILLEDYNALIATITASKDELTQYNVDYAVLIADVTAAKETMNQAEITRQATFDALVDSEMIAQNVATKLTEKEATFAPRMLSLESELAGKAQQSALLVEKARIDGFTTLAAGSTTGDSELIDGRIGADAVTYPNIGGAVRGQFVKVADILGKSTTDQSLWEIGSISGTSNLVSTIRMRTKTYIAADVLSIKSSNGYLMYLYAYENGAYIGYWGGSGFVTSGAVTTNFHDFAKLKNNYPTYKYRVIVKNATDGTMTLADYANVSLQINKHVLATIAETDFVKKYGIAEVDEANTTFITAGNQKFDKSKATEVGYYHYQTGIYNSDNTYRTSKPIKVTPGEIYTEKAIGHIVFRKKDGGYNGGALNGSTTDSVTFTIPDNTATMTLSVGVAYVDTCMLNLGATILPYENFEYSMDMKNIRYENALTPTDFSVFEQAYIKNKELIANNVTMINNTVAQYTGAKMEGRVITVKAKVKFYSGAYTTFIAEPNGLYSVEDVTVKSIHVNLSGTQSYVGYFDGKVLTNTYEKAYTVAEGVEVTVGFDLDLATNTLTVYLPDGTTYTVVNANYAACTGAYAMWEHYINITSRPFVSNEITKIYAKDEFGNVLCDDFKRLDGAIGIAPTGQVYGQFTGLNQTAWTL